MTITEFAKTHNVQINTVSKYIREHEEIQKHTTNKGKVRELDDAAVEMLEKKYPNPKPVIIGLDPEEHWKEVSELKDEIKDRDEVIKKLLKQINEIQQEQMDLKVQNMYLEDKKNEQNKEIEQLNTRIDTFNSRSFFGKIFNKI